MPIDLDQLVVREARRQQGGGVKRRYYRKSDGKQVCGAKCRSGGETDRCSRSTGLSPSGRCRLHGGAPTSGRPPTTGRWALAAGRLADAYKAAKESPELSDLRRPLAILDAQVERALELADQADCPRYRERALECFRALKAAVADGDIGEVQSSMASLGRVLNEGAKEEQAQAHVTHVTERFMKRLERVWDIKLARGNSVNAKDLTSILGRIVDAVTQAAPPEVARRVLHSLDSEFRAIAGVLEPREVEAEAKPRRA